MHPTCGIQEGLGLRAANSKVYILLQKLHLLLGSRLNNACCKVLFSSGCHPGAIFYIAKICHIDDTQKKLSTLLFAFFQTSKLQCVVNDLVDKKQAMHVNFTM